MKILINYYKSENQTQTQVGVANYHYITNNVM
jgi:hypothetical protein